jgi:hypothetical protein
MVDAIFCNASGTCAFVLSGYSEDWQQRTLAAIADACGGQTRQIQHFTAADKEYGTRVAKALGIISRDW